MSLTKLYPLNDELHQENVNAENGGPSIRDGVPPLPYHVWRGLKDCGPKEASIPLICAVCWNDWECFGEVDSGPSLCMNAPSGGGSSRLNVVGRRHQDAF